MNSNLTNSYKFRHPPPGFPRALQPRFAIPPPPPPENGVDVKYTPIKTELSSPVPSGMPNMSRYAYYQGSSIQTEYPRPPAQNHQDMGYSSGSSNSPPVGARHFSVPPPPAPYPTVAASPLSYAMNGNMYTFTMPPTPPPPVIGAGHYVAKKQGNYPQYSQGDYNSGYAKRGGYYSPLNRKRNPHEYDSDVSRKTIKKKKKPLSQNLPSKKEWTMDDAHRALAVEREYNKLHKNPSLIIKFPDLELNRDIVSAFHPLIESVHFQQPSTPRFCFVTLSDASRINEVINDLNSIKFGQGNLCAEPKNTKEEDSVKGPEDIDPLTLYVGNLAQEVTVDDVVKVYPNNKRIDIGYAKKMKYTRYAFVSFHTVDDAIEAFQSTHSTEMRNKSLIVRFRRLHGTVGLPGDAKQSTPRRQRPELEGEKGDDHTEDEASRSNFLARDLYDNVEMGLPDLAENDEKVAVKEEPFEGDERPVVDYESEDTVHVPLAQPKLEPVDLPISTEIKQEKPDADELSGQDDDFMRLLGSDDEEDTG